MTVEEEEEEEEEEEDAMTGADEQPENQQLTCYLM